MSQAPRLSFSVSCALRTATTTSPFFIHHPHITYPKHIHFPSSHCRPQPLPTSTIPIPLTTTLSYPPYIPVSRFVPILSSVHDSLRPLVTIDAPHRHDSHIFQFISFSSQQYITLSIPGIWDLFPSFPKVVLRIYPHLSVTPHCCCGEV